MVLCENVYQFTSKWMLKLKITFSLIEDEYLFPNQNVIWPGRNLQVRGFNATASLALIAG